MSNTRKAARKMQQESEDYWKGKPEHATLEQTDKWSAQHAHAGAN